MKFKRLPFALLLIVAVVLASCGGPSGTQAPEGAATEAVEATQLIGETGGEGETPAETAQPASDISGTIVFAYPGEETELTMRPEIVQRFIELHPNITVQEQPVPPEGYDTQITAQIAAGTPPDVFVSGDVQVAHYIKNGVAADLTPFFEADPDLAEEDFYPEVIDYFRGPDGHVYMMPDTIDVQRVYYNADLFNQAGVPLPTEEWTWEDFKNAAAKITSGEGPEKTYGFYTDNWWAVWLPYVWMNGGDILSEDGSTCILDQPEAIEALEWYGDFSRQGYSPTPEELLGLGMGPWDLFVTGRVGMYQTGGWDIPGIEEEADFEWGMAPLPRGKEFATFLHLTNYVMAADSQNQEAAWEFMKFLASEETYTLEATKYGWGVPPRPEAADAIVANPPEGTSEKNLLNVQIGQASAANGRLPAKILNWDEFTADGVDVGLEAFFNGSGTAADATKAACSVQPEPFGG